MSYLYSIFTAFLAGLFLVEPGCVYAQKGVRPYRKAQEALTHKVPQRGVTLFPFNVRQYARRFPQGTGPLLRYEAIPYFGENAIGLSVALERNYVLAQLKHPIPVRDFPGKRELDAVIFDLDGTLLDSLAAWDHSGSNFVRSQGFEPPADLDEKLVAMSLLDGANLIKEMYHLSYTPQEILEMTLRPIQEHYYTDIEPMPGVAEMLARLRAEGVKMAVATAGDAALAEAALRRLGLWDYFEFIITCDEVGVGKSSPAVYEAALKRLGTAKARTLVAEDALHALQTARAAGFPTAAIEESHSAHQRLEKNQAATYYVLSFQGHNVFTVGN